MTELASALSAPILRSSVATGSLSSQSAMVDASPAAARRSLYDAGSLPGIHNLSAALTINSQTVFPMFRYKGQDASASGWPAWGYGADLDYVTPNAGTQFRFGSPFQGPDDDSVKFAGVGSQGFFRCPDTSVGVIGANEDWWIEALIRAHGGAAVSGGIVSKFGSGARWLWSINTNNTLSFTVSNGTTTITNSISTGTGTPWLYVVCVGHRPGNMQTFANAIRGGTTSIAALAASAVHSGRLATAGSDIGSSMPAIATSYMAGYKLQGWFSTADQQEAVNARFHALWSAGVAP